MRPHMYRLAVVALCLSSGVLCAAERAPAPPVRLSPAGFRGALFLNHSDQPSERVLKRFVELAGGEKAKVAIVELNDANGPEIAAALEAQRIKEEINMLGFSDAATANDDEALAPLAEATAIWIAGHDERGDAKLLRGSKLQKLLEEALAKNKVILFSGPIATIAGQYFVDGATKTDGLGLFPNTIIVSGGECSGPGTLGIRLRENAALLIRGREVRSLGEEVVTLNLCVTPERPARTIELAAGDVADYNELLRAARGRGEPAYPGPEVGVPEVKTGALVIVGGGGMPKEIGERFVTLGGGEEGRFVILPTAMPDPLPPDGSVGMLKRFGAKHISVISAREQSELETPENIKLLEEATGIWFGGGRQWRFVDAYEGTKLHELFHGVLARGGVIGGSSAGATIQGEYLVRGAPAGPHIMMCEGYERGLNFLPGVAIDQHFAQRRRFADMTALMKAYPQFLGIGLDEATALVVQGSTAEVLGAGEAHFYNRREEVNECEKDYVSVKAGGKYELKERKVVGD